MDINRILSRVPDYKTFDYLDEMNYKSIALAKEFPQVVSIFEAGVSKSGRKIIGLKIGNGSQAALCYGSPHPNEPIGCMTLDTLSRQLAEDEELRNELDYSWYIIKSSDVDGTELNEGWFKGPFTATNYQKHFFRPAFNQQVEWSFPIDYKNLHFHTPTKETQMLMKIIDDVHPTFIYSLHNSSFGGVYWYLTDGDQKLFDKLHSVPSKYGLGISAGEPEMPYAVELSPAIYKMTNVKDDYDYEEKYGDKNDLISDNTMGGCSDDYANRRGKIESRIFVNEMPYFYDKRSSDTSPSDITHRDALPQSVEIGLADLNKWVPIFNEVKNYLTNENPFYLFVNERSSGEKGLLAKKKWIMDNEKDNSSATVSQKFDCIVETRWYSNLNIASLWRGCEYEITNNKSLSVKGKEKLQEASKKLEDIVDQNLSWLEDHLNYQAIDISTLVKVQLECGLYYAKYVHDKVKG